MMFKVSTTLGLMLVLTTGCSKPAETRTAPIPVATRPITTKAVPKETFPITKRQPTFPVHPVGPSKEDVERVAKEAEAKKLAMAKAEEDRQEQARLNAIKKAKEDELVNFDGQDYKNREQFLSTYQINLLKTMNRWLIDKVIVDVQFPGSVEDGKLGISYNDFIFSKFNIFNKPALKKYYLFLANSSKECKEYIDELKPKNYPVDEIKELFMLLNFDDKLVIQDYLKQLRIAGRPGDIDGEDAKRFVFRNKKLFDLK